MMGSYCCAGHESEHEKDLLRDVEQAGMRLIPVHAAIGHGAGGEYVLIFPDGSGSLHPQLETAAGEAQQYADMARTGSAKKLKKNIRVLLDAYGVREHRRPLERAMFAAIDAYAATRKGAPDLAKLARDAS